MPDPIRTALEAANRCIEKAAEDYENDGMPNNSRRCRAVLILITAALALLDKHSERESCICAAIRLPNGFVVRGHRHDDCYNVIRKRPCPERYREALYQSKQGFMTTRNRFVGRQEAMEIQRASGLPSHYGLNREYNGDQLFSEDLYPDSAIDDALRGGASA